MTSSIPICFVLCCVVPFETVSHYVAQAVLEFEIFLLQSPDCWNYINFGFILKLPKNLKKTDAQA
jgi:hypothetical protein